LIRGGIARATRLHEVPIKTIKFKNGVLIIGGGVAGINAALDCAKRGMEVHLVERENRLGGRLNQLYKLFPHGDDAREMLESLLHDLEKHPNIITHLETRIEEMTGHVGDYSIILNENGVRKSVNVGGVIVAVGTKTYTPKHGEYGYGLDERILTTLELEEMLKNDKIEKPSNIIFIQCVGSRAFAGEPGNVHCSRTCCNVSLINSEILKNKFPECRINILYKEHFRAFGRYMEEKYRELMLRGVTFTRFKHESSPEVFLEDGEIKVRYTDSLLNRTFIEKADYVILSVGQEAPEEIEHLCEVLGITRSQDGFIEEMHIKFRPVETKVAGVFTSASFPKDIADTINMARGAASGIHQLQKGIELELIIADVKEDVCVGCGLCEPLCPYNAISMKETSPGMIISITDEIQCAGCGTCVASCPVGARDLRWWTDDQILAQIEAILRE
ncbi:MAG: CoB--CoM heterodisulfide reductase iron-sulfur subunit A family protein, partial [Candidatus Helarchaeales archaeon]